MNDDDRRPPELDHATVRRWICARAHAMGWTEELFEKFDEGPRISRERMGNHRVERIGKKYQHIALAEVTARLTDNLAVCCYHDDGKLRAFEYGPSGRDMKKDIDPSLLVRSTQESGWSSTPVTWWTPSSPRLPSGDTDLLLAWVAVESDLCNGPDEIEVVSPDGRTGGSSCTAFATGRSRVRAGATTQSLGPTSRAWSPAWVPAVHWPRNC
jgi:hypothetical protein